jgi:cytochrome c peroxidase
VVTEGDQALRHIVLVVVQGPLAFDAALRQQITHLYPAQLPDVPQPCFHPLGAKKGASPKALFLAPNFSRGGTLGCTSCYRPEHGFASPYQVPPECHSVRGRLVRSSRTGRSIRP